MNNKKIITDYFSFSKKDRKAVFLLLFVISLLIILSFVLPSFVKPTIVDATAFKQQVEALKLSAVDTSRKFTPRQYDETDYAGYRHYDEDKPVIAGTLFYFDPNTATADDWHKLGLRDKTIKTMLNYTSKGGKFKTAEDIRKVWGLKPAEADRLIPFIQIASTKPVYNYPKENTTTFTEKKTYTPTSVDINTSDTSEWIALPGIGSKLSQRIITFKNKLGGFYSIEQVKETYGLPDSTFQKIRPRLILSSVQLQKININTVDYETLKSHAYMGYKIAKAIIEYRNQHGNFSSVADIKKIMIITDDVYEKIYRYLQIE